MRTTGTFGRRVRFVALCFVACGAHAAAQRYTVTDLGTLSGDKVSAAYALNNSGEAAGKSSTPTGAIATMFSAGKATSISTLGSDVSVATAINGLGEIVGYNFFYSNPNFDPRHSCTATAA